MLRLARHWPYDLAGLSTAFRPLLASFGLLWGVVILALLLAWADTVNGMEEQMIGVPLDRCSSQDA